MNIKPLTMEVDGKTVLAGMQIPRITEFHRTHFDVGTVEITMYRGGSEDLATIFVRSGDGTGAMTLSLEKLFSLANKINAVKQEMNKVRKEFENGNDTKTN